MKMIELLERARKVQGDISYYEVAKRLNVSDQVMTKWKQDISKPNGINTLKLAEMAKVSPSEALRLLQKGYASVALLFVLVSCSTLALAYIPYFANTVYYVKSFRVRNQMKSVFA